MNDAGFSIIITIEQSISGKSHMRTGGKKLGRGGGQKFANVDGHLTIIRRRRGDYRGIFAETKF
jgi:hypothetical protein